MDGHVRLYNENGNSYSVWDDYELNKHEYEIISENITWKPGTRVNYALCREKSKGTEKMNLTEITDFLKELKKELSTAENNVYTFLKLHGDGSGSITSWNKGNDNDNDSPIFCFTSLSQLKEKIAEYRKSNKPKTFSIYKVPSLKLCFLEVSEGLQKCKISLSDIFASFSICIRGVCEENFQLEISWIGKDLEDEYVIENIKTTLKDLGYSEKE